MAANTAFVLAGSTLRISENYLVETVDIELAAHHAVIELVSCAKSGTGIFTAETDAERQPFYRLRLNLETRRKRKRPYFQRDKCEVSERSSIPMTGWWAHQGSNLGPAD
jgi:hypothetical protein